MTSPREDEKRVVPDVEPVTTVTVHTHTFTTADGPARLLLAAVGGSKVVR